MRARAASIVVWVTSMFSWVSHSTYSRDLGRRFVLFDDAEDERFISCGKGLICWGVAFLVVVVIASE